MKTVKQILIEARELISDPRHWTTCAWARDEFGKSVGVSCGTAFCSVGAIERAAGDWRLEKYAALDAFRRVVQCDYLPEFNDTHTHAEVLAAFTRAIEQCRE